MDLGDLAYVGRGKRVVAVDTDSNPNLALSLGLDEAAADQALNRPGIRGGTRPRPPTLGPGHP